MYTGSSMLRSVVDGSSMPLGRWPGAYTKTNWRLAAYNGVVDQFLQQMKKEIWRGRDDRGEVMAV